MVETFKDLEEAEKMKAIHFSRWLLDRIGETANRGLKDRDEDDMAEGLALARVSGLVDGGVFRLMQMETARDIGERFRLPVEHKEVQHE